MLDVHETDSVPRRVASLKEYRGTSSPSRLTIPCSDQLKPKHSADCFNIGAGKKKEKEKKDLRSKFDFPKPIGTSQVGW